MAKHQLDIVGGVYRELCQLPQSDTWRGSGGRAAIVAAQLGVVAHLHTCGDEEVAFVSESMGLAYQFAVSVNDHASAYRFQYLHPLAPPALVPRPRASDRTAITVDCELALVFGMVNVTTAIRSPEIVFDPQSPGSPRPLNLTSTPKRLAYVLNRNEASILGSSTDPEIASRQITSKWGAQVVVVKLGAEGALVFEGDKSTWIPSFLTDRVWPIGSGDVFSSVFAVHWLVEGKPAAEAAYTASMATAVYVSNRNTPITKAVLDTALYEGKLTPSTRSRPLSPGEYHVYLASPFFCLEDRWFVGETKKVLESLGLRVFSPLHNVGMGEASEVAPRDLDGLIKSRVTLALLSHLDPGTIFEVGYARARGKPVVGLAQAVAPHAMTMLEGTDCELYDDYSSAIYRCAWRANS